MLLITYIRALWQFARPRTMLLIWLHLGIFYSYLTLHPPKIFSLIVALVATLAGYIAAVALNDMSDKVVDSLNLLHQGEAGDRPLINGTLSSEQARWIALVAAIFFVTSSMFLAPWLGIVALLMMGMNYMYSMPPVQISRRGGMAQALLPLMYVGFPAAISLAIAGSDVSSSFLVFVAGLYILFVGRLFLKDIRDEVGDKAVGKRTFLVRHGLKAYLSQSVIWSVIGITVSLWAFLAHSFDWSLVAVAGVALAGIVWGEWCCYTAINLEQKLIWVAVIGRFASMWVFCAFIVLLLKATQLSGGQQQILIGITAAMFLAGVGMLIEELHSVQRRQKIGR